MDQHNSQATDIFRSPGSLCYFLEVYITKERHFYQSSLRKLSAASEKWPWSSFWINVRSFLCYSSSATRNCSSHSIHTVWPTALMDLSTRTLGGGTCCCAGASGVQRMTPMHIACIAQGYRKTTPTVFLLFLTCATNSVPYSCMLAQCIILVIRKMGANKTSEVNWVTCNYRVSGKSPSELTSTLAHAHTLKCEGIPDFELSSPKETCFVDNIKIAFQQEPAKIQSMYRIGWMYPSWSTSLPDYMYC